MFAPSKYNSFALHPSGSWVGYNARTGALLSLEPAAYDDFLRASSQSDFQVLAGRWPTLERAGFITESDELQEIRDRFSRSRRKAGHLFLTILPTLSCNRKCDYCFQEGYRFGPGMRRDVGDAVLAFIASNSQDVDRITLSWFGGEPLLRVDIVEEMTARIKRHCEEHSILLESSIITNATLLTRPIAQRIAAVGVVSAQVSIDALVDNGVTRRGVVDSEGNPSQIVRNIQSSSDLINISIRVNLDSTSSSDLEQIMARLGEFGLSSQSYFARIHDDNQQRSGSSSCQNYAPESFAEDEFREYLSKPDGIYMLMKQLTPRSSFCTATSEKMFVIDAEGFVYKCWHSAGRSEEAIGSVLDGEANENAWLTSSPFENPMCLSCRVLPLCMGGCFHPRMGNGETDPACESIRFNIDRAVEYVATHVNLHVATNEQPPLNPASGDETLVQ